MSRLGPTNVQYLLAMAEDADHEMREHIDSGGDMYDLRWYSLDAAHERAWSAYLEAMDALNAEAQ